MDFDEIYRANAALVYRYLFSLSQDPDLSEELTQQTFYEAIRRPDRFRGDAALSTYLCGIAKNLLRHERQSRARRREQPLEEAEALPSGTGSEEEALARLQRQELFRRIHALPEQQREVVYLRLSGELSFAEIGAVLGRSENWARVTFYRAKCALKGDDA